MSLLNNSMKYTCLDQFDVATDEMITAYEKTLGYHLPISFVEFLETAFQWDILIGL